jgi:hypothetical protein
MNRLALVVTMLFFSAGLWAEFSCPDGTKPACLDRTDKVCGASTKCVDESSTCFDGFPCDAHEGFVCGSEYDAALHEHARSTEKYAELAAQNVDLRQQRLDRKNCVLNATSLDQAQECVR